jgi:hypothetical protein
MMVSLAFSILLSSPAHAAEKAQSDCKAIEMKTLRNNAVVDTVSNGAKLVAYDCTVVKSGKGSEKLLVLYHLDSAAGVESRFAVFNRAGLAPSSRPLFTSDSLGFDSFFMVAAGRHRMLFVVPGSGKIRVYTTTQTDANTNRFAAHELDMSERTFKDVPDHAWPVSAGRQIKIFKEKGQWRAVVNGKIVDL